MSPDIKPSFPRITRRAGLVATLFVGSSIGILLDARGVSADGPTPRPSPTSTLIPTPDVIGTQITEAKKTSVALDNRQNQEREAANQEKQLADIRARNEARQTTPTIPPTPTEKPTPAPTLLPAEKTATAEGIRLSALGSRQAEIKGTATADAERSVNAQAIAAATADARAVKAAEAAQVLKDAHDAQLRAAQGGINVEREIIKGELVAGLTLLGLVVLLTRAGAARRNRWFRDIAAGYTHIKPGLRRIWVIGRIF